MLCVSALLISVSCRFQPLDFGTSAAAVAVSRGLGLVQAVRSVRGMAADVDLAFPCSGDLQLVMHCEASNRPAALRVSDAQVTVRGVS